MRTILSAVAGLALLGASMVASAHPLERPWFGQHGPVVLAPRLAPVVVAPPAVFVGAPCVGPARVGVDRVFFPHADGRRVFVQGWRR